MAKTDHITAERLRELLDYDPETGLLTWKIDRGPKGRIGSVAGCIRKDGYITIRVDDVMHQAHNLAFLWMTGRRPEKGKEIDHENMDKGDNRWINLREASRSQNGFNRTVYSSNPIGIKGVYFRENCPKIPWEARISVSGKVVWKHTCATAQEAIDARAAALTKFHGKFSRHQ